MEKPSYFETGDNHVQSCSTKKLKQHTQPNGETRKQDKSSKNKSTEEKKRQQREADSLKLWKRPFTTVYYFIRELLHLIFESLIYVFTHKVVWFCLALIAALSAALFVLYEKDPTAKRMISFALKKLSWWGWWVTLGFLSSCGLGTGLHTFLIYLGPFIAKVTLAGYECGSVDFPEPPFPEEFVCPNEGRGGGRELVTLFTIVQKVQIEAILWGLGTAIGELPPYFMARASRLSGEENKELAELESKSDSKSYFKRPKKFVHDLVIRLGFIGIVACASIPNPLFDLAGFTCGHFLVPFWSFFGATVIGKAIIKMHIQQLFVILVFSEHHVQYIMQLIGNLPYGSQIQAPFLNYMNKQKESLHKGVSHNAGQSPLQIVMSVFVWCMLIGFFVSIVNSLAQNFYKRVQKRQHKKGKKLQQSETTDGQQKDRTAQKTGDHSKHSGKKQK